MKIIYRKKRLYYHKFGYRINDFFATNEVLRYIKTNFKKDEYLINSYNGLYFKNKKDAKKVIKKFQKYFDKRKNMIFYMPADGFESCIGNCNDPKLWYGRFPHKLTMIKKHSWRVTNVERNRFNSIVNWCEQNFEGPYKAAIPTIFIISQSDAIALKLAFSGQLKPSKSINEKWIKDLLKDRINEAKRDLKIFSDG